MEITISIKQSLRLLCEVVNQHADPVIRKKIREEFFENEAS